MKKFISFLVLCGVLLSSCSHVYQVSLKADLLKQFVGKKYNDIVRELGAPNRQMPDGSGGNILIYEETTQQSVATAHNINYMNRTYTPGMTTTSHTSYVQFYVDRNNTCYDVNTNKTKTVVEKNPKSKKVGIIVGSILGALVVGGFAVGIALGGE